MNFVYTTLWLKMEKEKYRPRDKLKDRNKITINKIYSRISKRNIGNALILDGETLQTTKNLVKIGYKKSDIYIPNPFSFEKIKTKRSINVYNMLLGDFINKANEENLKFTTTFFDYCCNINGNDEIKPFEDIGKYFENELAKDNSIFALTFSYRKNKKSEYLHEDLLTTQAYIEEIANENGYIAKFSTGRVYKGMVFLLYKIKKI